MTLCILGSSNLDHILALSDFPKPGETLAAKSYQVVYGGKGANQAVAAAKSGAIVNFISAVGQDGTVMRDHFASLGINIENLTIDTQQPTGMAMIEVTENGENAIVIVAGANKTLNEEFVALARHTIEQSDIFLTQLETPLEGIAYAISIAHQAGKRIVLNPAPARLLPDTLLEKLWLITPNETEAEILTGIAIHDEHSAEKAAWKFHDKNIPHVIITMGRHGVYHHHENHGILYPAFKVKAVDTTAAGDTFNGALLASLMQENDFPTAIRFAQAAAALSVQKNGAQPSIPNRQEIMNFLVTYSGQ